MVSQRIVWIDFIKGILLFLICIGHLSVSPNWVKPIIRPTALYYVPFFFILSGFLYSGKMSVGQYIRRKVKTLLFPYIFFSLLFIVIDWDTYLSCSCLPNSLYKAFVVGVGAPRSSPLWFVLLLFTTSIAGCLILKHCNNKFGVYLCLGGAISLSLCAWLLSAYSIRLPLLLHLLPSATCFWLGGYLIARLLYSRCANLKYVIFVIVCPLMCYLSCDIGDMHFNIINSYPAFFVMPISCAYFVICISYRLRNYIRGFITSLPAYVARNGIVVLATHLYFITLIEGPLKAFNVELDTDMAFFLKIAFVSIMLYFFGIPLGNKYLYMLQAKLR